LIAIPSLLSFSITIITNYNQPLTDSTPISMAVRMLISRTFGWQIIIHRSWEAEVRQSRSWTTGATEAKSSGFFDTDYTVRR